MDELKKVNLTNGVAHASLTDDKPDLRRGIKLDTPKEVDESIKSLGLTEGGMQRNPEGKPEWQFVHFPSLIPMVQVLEYGAVKYNRDNWKKGYPIRRTLGSLMRHIVAFSEGETIDPESGLPHIGHMFCNLMFMQYMLDNKPEYDDRVKE